LKGKLKFVPRTLNNSLQKKEEGVSLFLRNTQHQGKKIYLGRPRAVRGKRLEEGREEERPRPEGGVGSLRDVAAATETPDQGIRASSERKAGVSARGGSRRGRLGLGEGGRSTGKGGGLGVPRPTSTEKRRRYLREG